MFDGPATSVLFSFHPSLLVNYRRTIIGIVKKKSQIRYYIKARVLSQNEQKGVGNFRREEQ